MNSIAELVNKIGQKAKQASATLRIANTEQKNSSLLIIGNQIQENKQLLIDANNLDMNVAKKNNIDNALLDRLMLNEERLDSVVESLKHIANLDDPIGKTSEFAERPSGIKIGKMMVPLGVIGMIYESRPNVTVDAAALCIKSGNAVILRGGSEAINSNMAFYKCDPDKPADVGSAKQAINSLGSLLGLKTRDDNLCADEDNYSVLSVSEGARRNRYIPYTNRPINWHTDGYYNSADQKIKGMGLHCISPAAVGGENALMDPEIVYILLRDENPDFISALMHPQAMEVPANSDSGINIRPVQGGPVFSLCGNDAALHMRYTARTRSIRWRQDEVTKAAIDFLHNLLNSNSPYIFRRRMEAGEGLLCNNVLHKLFL